MSDFDYDLFVIGTGSGGVRASRIAASHGARVAAAEEFRIGGTCVIRGCVPKKLLVYGADFAEDLHAAERFGWTLEGATFNWPTLRDNVAAEVDRLEGLYQQTFDNNHVEVFRERAVIADAHTVELASGRRITARVILIATGAWPSIPEIDGAEHGITSNEVFHLPALPRRILIAGAGFIANEFAGIFNTLGVDIVLATRGERMLRGYDDEIVDRLVAATREKGIDVRFNFGITRVEKRDDGTLIVHEKGGETVETDMVLWATGRAPNSRNLGLEAVGVAVDADGAIVVDEYSQTSVPSIYAVGDVINRMQLTPVAIREGHAFADSVFGNNPRTVEYANIPSAVFSNPQIAGVGLTEAEARAQLAEVKVFRSDFRPMKNVLANRAERALYKMVVDGSNDRVVGVHMIGPESGEILQVAAIAVHAGLTKAVFDSTVALHPSMSEELVLMR